MKKSFIFLLIFTCVFVLMDNFLVMAQKLSFDYATQIGAPGASVIAGHYIQSFDEKDRILAVDKNGFVYASGEISSGSPEFDVVKGGKTLNVSNGRNYIAKYDSLQNLIWVKQYGKILIRTTSVAVDTLGNVYLGGFFTTLTGNNDLSTGSTPAIVNSVGLRDMFISKLDSSGNLLWAKTWGSTRDDQLNGLAIDDLGDIYATGKIGGPVDFNPGSANSSLTAPISGFVLKLNTSGNFIWVKGWDGNVNGNSIILDHKKNILITGNLNTSDKVDFDPGKGTADTFFLKKVGGASDAFVTKLNKDGDFLWARSFGGPEQDQGFSIDVDEAGAVYTTGIFSDIADFNPWGNSFEMKAQPRASNPSTIKMEVFVSKIDADGNFQWARQLNGPGENWAWSIAVGKGKAIGVYVTGHFEGSADFYQGKDTLRFVANPTNRHSYKNEAFLFKLDTSGNFEWSILPGGNVSSSVVVDDHGNVFSTGYFDKNTTVDFNPDPNQTHIVNRLGSSDGYIHKMKWCNLSDTISEIVCNQFVYNDIVYKKSGMYTVPNLNGCDTGSTIVLDLTIFNLDPEITIDEKTLGTTQSYSTYQWLKDGGLIVGATNDKYTVTENGDYQVVVSDEEGCVDTSKIYVVKNIVDIRAHQLTNKIKIYPNPTQDLIYFDAPFRINVSLYTIEGRKVKELTDPDFLSMKNLVVGMYLLYINDEKGNQIQIQKIVKTP